MCLVNMCVRQRYLKADNAEGSYDGQETAAGTQHLSIIYLQLLAVF
jgi:hypothetical protein